MRNVRWLGVTPVLLLAAGAIALGWVPESEPAKKPAKPAKPLTAEGEKLFAQGKELFQQACTACHGQNGEGVVPVAPPLLNSGLVLGSHERLIRIILQGMTGPIEVNGTRYEPPQILPEMPMLEVLEDTQIAAVLTYIRRAWNHQADEITPAQVAKVRQETLDRLTPWTQEELLQIKLTE